MKHILSFLVLLSIALHINAQRDLMREMADNYLKIRQKPGTEKELQQYLEKTGTEEDTIYAIIFKPTYCRRCEHIIPALRKAMKKTAPDKKLLLISAYNNKTAAEAYNKRNKYDADYYIYDTNSEYLNIFSFNFAGDICGAYVLKMCKKSGNLLIGGENTQTSKEFVSQLTAWNGYMEKQDFKDETNKSDNDINLRETEKFGLLKTRYTDYKIYDAAYPISGVYDIPHFIDNRFFFTDELAEGAMVFRLDKDSLKWQGIIQPNENEKTKFVKISPEHLKEHFTDKGSIFYITCGVNIIDNKYIGVSCSLPDIRYEDADYGDIALAYYNQPAIITRDINTLKADSIIPIAMDMPCDSDYFFQHFRFEAIENKFITGCEKLTWPIEVEKEEYIQRNDMNPFCTKFYDSDNPIMAVFEKGDGTCSYMFGHLEECQKKSMSGYYYFNPIMTHFENKLIYGNGCTGKIYVADKNDLSYCEKEYTVFDINTSAFPEADSTKFHTYEYPLQYAKFFYRTIQAIQANDKHIYSIVRYGNIKNVPSVNDRYLLVDIERSTGKHDIKRLPDIPEGYENLGFGLWNNNNKILPFAFLRGNNQCFVRVFSLLKY